MQQKKLVFISFLLILLTASPSWSEEPLFRFIQVSDIHIGKSSQTLVNLTNAVTQINGINPSFVLLTGDLTDSGSMAQYSALKTAVSGLTVPYYCVPGDNDVIDGEGTLQRYRDQMGDDYYAFDYQGFKFIGINNTSNISLDDTQRAWLESELQAGMPEMLFAHAPLLDYASSFTPFAGADPLLTLLDTYNAVMYMSGHEHKTASCTYNDTDFIWCKNLSYAHMGDPYNLYEVYTDHVVLYHIDLRYGSSTYVGSFTLAESPTLITLASFEAVPSSGRVSVTWATESEIDNAGFNLYRCALGGSYVKINNSVIPAKGSPTVGADYEFEDTGLQNRKTYSYKLEDVDANGVSTFHGPVSAAPRLIYGLSGK